MALRVGEHLAASLTGLRWEPIERRARAWAGDRLLLDTNHALPVRHYLPREDVVADLHPSDTVTTCAYKGRASYLSSATRRDVAWTYPAPLPDAAQLTDLVAFFGERLDIEVDGVVAERRPTPWS
ncbi:MAG: DUF427 domain-containing protein [Pseudonocardia sp.]|uniref:DUF427 domain-containing protein n=1 Tax=unclassified Pseudonocardia TaxID=2619320 RepID=UPI000ABFAC4B|nr:MULTISPECIES: DUF427 domain-containing protein [unclassified Pseudonocardia]MBN9108422.1 DUF427 domain-containing protein [Pseudonocardia sp.]